MKCYHCDKELIEYPNSQGQSMWCKSCDIICATELLEKFEKIRKIREQNDIESMSEEMIGKHNDFLKGHATGVKETLEELRENIKKLFISHDRADYNNEAVAYNTGLLNVLIIIDGMFKSDQNHRY